MFISLSAFDGAAASLSQYLLSGPHGFPMPDGRCLHHLVAFVVGFWLWGFCLFGFF